MTQNGQSRYTDNIGNMTQNGQSRYTDNIENMTQNGQSKYTDNIGNRNMTQIHRQHWEHDTESQIHR